MHFRGGGRWQPSAPRAGAGSAAGAVNGYSRRSVAGYSLGACSLGPLGGRGWYTLGAGSSSPRERLVRCQSSSFKNFHFLLSQILQLHFPYPSFILRTFLIERHLLYLNSSASQFPLYFHRFFFIFFHFTSKAL